MRRRMTRFNKEEYFKHNMAMVDGLKVIAEKKGITPAALCLAWVASLGPKVIPIPGSSCVFHHEPVFLQANRLVTVTPRAPLSTQPLQISS